MNVTKLPIAFQDQRGEIIDVLQKGHIEYVTIIHSRKDAVRANHYHKTERGLSRLRAHGKNKRPQQR